MEGARGDLEGRFGPVLDIHAVVAERDEVQSPAEAAPRSTVDPLLVKAAGDTDWQTLPAERDAA